MRTYFASYIPVDEPIRVGNRGITKSFITSVIDKDYFKELKSTDKLKQYQKAELYMCFSDPKEIGDKVYLGPYGLISEIEKVGENGNVWLKNMPKILQETGINPRYLIGFLFPINDKSIKRDSFFTHKEFIDLEKFS